MSKRVRKTTIMGREVQIYILKASIGVAMTHKLGGIVAGFFDSKSEEITIDFGRIADSLSTKLPYEELDMMIKALISGIAIDGKDVDFEEEFAGNYGFLMKIITYALEENFGSFFEGTDILGK